MRRYIINCMSILPLRTCDSSICLSNQRGVFPNKANSHCMQFYTRFTQPCSSVPYSFPLRFIIRPKLDVAVLTQAAPLHELSLLLHDFLDRDTLLIPKDPQVITDDMSVPAFWTRNERRARVVPLFRDIVVAAMPTRHAGEGELVVGRFLPLGERGAAGFGG